MNNKNSPLHQTLEGRYKVSVVSGDGKTVIWEQPEWKKNLILNNGMDLIASTPYTACFYYAVGGTGTRVNSVLSGDSPSSQAGTTVTLTPGTTITSFTQSLGGHAQLLSVGDVIAYDTSSAVTVQTVSNTTCTVDISQTVSPAEGFTIWKTSQTGLHNAVETAGGDNGSSKPSPSGSYWLSGFCGNSFSGNTYHMYRTYDFRLEPSLVSYTEIGVASQHIHGVLPSTTFSRILLGVPVSVDAGQRLRVAYALDVRVQPTASIFRSGSTVPIITNWPVAPTPNLNATESLQGTSTNSQIELVTSTGGASNSGQGFPLDPMSSGTNCAAWISEKSASLSSFGSATDRTGTWTGFTSIGMTRAAYAGTGTYYADKTVTFGLTQANSTNLRSMGFGYLTTNAHLTTQQSYVLLFNYSQSKTNVQTLTLSWRWSWARSLSNGE